jgi:nucleoside-diphosphate-sugar epimerase
MLSWWLNEIAVIGTGNIGGMLARKLSAAGHDLRGSTSLGVDIRVRGPHGIPGLSGQEAIIYHPLFTTGKF